MLVDLWPWCTARLVYVTMKNFANKKSQQQLNCNYENEEIEFQTIGSDELWFGSLLQDREIKSWEERDLQVPNVEQIVNRIDIFFTNSSSYINFKELETLVPNNDLVHYLET